jgi:hypothetical protein
MRTSSTAERWHSPARKWVAPALALTLGLGALAGERQDPDAAETAANPNPAAAKAAGAAALHHEVDDTVTGVIETPDGRKVRAYASPHSDHVTGKYPDESDVEIVCQAPGRHAPGDPIGKPPLADTTWYRVSPSGDPDTDHPDWPKHWMPQNPVVTWDPVPSCPR